MAGMTHRIIRLIGALRRPLPPALPPPPPARRHHVPRRASLIPVARSGPVINSARPVATRALEAKCAAPGCPTRAGRAARSARGSARRGAARSGGRPAGYRGRMGCRGRDGAWRHLTTAALGALAMKRARAALPPLTRYGCWASV